MKQVLQNLRTGQISVVEVPPPIPQPGQVLVHNAASLVSAGTERMVVDFAEKSLLGKARSRPDLVRQVLDKARREGVLPTVEAALNRLDQPMQLGYSSAGRVVAMGEGVQGWQVGQRVACGGGGHAVHAEYVAVPTNLVVPVPDSLDFEAAAFTTLGAIALHGFRLAGVQIGERVAVIGLGLLGLLSVGIVKAAGCQVMGIDLDAQRVDLALKMGADLAVLREQAESAGSATSQGRGFDAVLICADTPEADPVELAGAIARDRARVIAVGAVGLQIPRKVYYEKELTLINSRSYGPGRYDPAYEEGGVDYPIGYVRWTEGRNMQAFVDLIASGRVGVNNLVTHRYPIQQAEQAYELITGKQGEVFLGVLLTYPGAGTVDIPAQIGEASQAVGAAEKNALYPGEIPASPGESIKVDKVRLGVLGAGNFAMAVMLPALRGISSPAKSGAVIELVGIASASGASAHYAAQRFGFLYATSSVEQILQDERVNTIAILTRHQLHAQQVTAALVAGKNVFCEKPLALNEQQLTQIQQELRAQILTVGFNRRFAPLAVRLGEFIAERQEPLMAHYRVNAGFLPFTHWLHDPEQGGGRIIGEGCHFVDFLTYLVGTPPVSVQTQGLPDGGRYRSDNVLMSFRFADGSIGSVSYLANGDKSFGKERVEVFCGGKIAVLDDFRSLELVADGRRQVIRYRMRQDKGHQAEWIAFSQSILSGGSPPIPYAHLFGVTRATFAAVEALRTGELVDIPNE